MKTKTTVEKIISSGTEYVITTFELKSTNKVEASTLQVVSHKYSPGIFLNIIGSDGQSQRVALQDKELLTEIIDYLSVMRDKMN